MKTSTTSPQGVATTALLGWLAVKLANAENALKCREQMANAKPLTEEEWVELSKMPGVFITKGKKLSKAAIKRLIAKDAEEQPRHQRIAIICRHEVEMFKATIAALTQPNDKDQATDGARDENQPKKSK